MDASNYLLVLLLIPLLVISATEHDFRYISHKDLRLSFNTFSEEGVSTYSQLLFDVSRNQVVVGARDHLYRLSLGQLEVIESTIWESPKEKTSMCAFKGQTEHDCHNYPKVLLTNGKRLLTCGTNSFSPICTWREIDNITMITETMDGVAKCPFNPASNISALLTDRGDLCVGGPTNFGGSDYAIYRSSSGSGANSIRTKQYDSMWLNEPQFVGSFETDRYFYFLFREAAVEYINCGKIIYSRIARVCKNDQGGGSAHPVLRDNWTTFIKARLNCSVAGDYPFYYDEIQSATYVPGDNVVYATFTTPENGIAASAVCAFNLTAIDASFAGPFKSQEHTGSAWSRHHAPTRDHIDCPTPTTTTTTTHTHSHHHALSLGRHQLMDNAVPSIHPHPHPHTAPQPLYTATLERFTHITVDVLATKTHLAQHVLYVATSHGTIRKLTVLPRTLETCLVEVWQPIGTGTGTGAWLGGRGDAVLFMSYLKETNSVYVGTERAVLRVPAAHCGRHVSKRSCLEAMDPYCGWNMLENACTTAPDNEPLADHWLQEMRSCPVLDSAVDGGWSGWSHWDPCTKLTNPNQPDLDTSQYHHHHQQHHHHQSSSQLDLCQCQTRHCNNPHPQNGGATCAGIAIRVSNCTVHGDWTPYSAYSECSATCGNAVKTRFRTCTNPGPAHGGRVCVGRDRDEVICTNNPPCPIPISSVPPAPPAHWTPFTDWSVCTAKCGGGIRKRHRLCARADPAHPNVTRTLLDTELERDVGGGCYGSGEMYEECNRHQCPDKRVTQWTGWVGAGDGRQRRQKVHCKASLLKLNVLEVKVTFGKDEERLCPIGVSCGDSSVVRTIDDGETWQPWTPWSACSVSCGTGEQVRMRVCNSAHGCGDTGERTQVQRKVCAVPGAGCSDRNDPKLAECWSDWSPCSKSCDWGIQNRYRTCPAGATCYGDNVQEQPCKVEDCSSILGWDIWSAWTECDRNNEQHRKRSCSIVNPGADMCVGAMNETRMCLDSNNMNNDINAYNSDAVRTAGSTSANSDSLGTILVCVIVGFAAGCMAGIGAYVAYARRRRRRRNRIPGNPHYITVNAKQNPYTPVPCRELAKKVTSNGATGNCATGNGTPTVAPLMQISPPKMNNVTASPCGNGTIRSLKNFDTDCNTFKRNKSNHNSRCYDDKYLYE